MSCSSSAAPLRFAANGGNIPNNYINFDVGIDPNDSLSAYFSAITVPAHMVIRASDMTIRWTSSGTDTAGLKIKIDNILAGH